MPSTYWLLSCPLLGSKEDTWKRLHENITHVAFDTPVYKLFIPELRVGTLDSLLALSDDLVKATVYVEGVAQKMRRQVEDLDRGSSTTTPSLSVDGVSLESYITRFRWDEAKHPLMAPLRETCDSIHEGVAKLEDDLKVRVAEYNTVKAQLSAITRKAGGSLAVRDLSDCLESRHIVSSEHLATLMVVVPVHSDKEWLASYEALSPFVVPRSSQQVGADSEYALFTVTLFRKVADTFRAAARDKGFQVRDYDHDPAAVHQRQEDLHRLSNDLESVRGSLQHWLTTSFGEVFSAQMHLLTTRLFAESILRYGLPPAFQAAVVAPNGKTEKKLRGALETTFGGESSAFWKGESEASMAGLVGGEVDSYPYVSYTINLAATT